MLHRIIFTETYLLQRDELLVTCTGTDMQGHTYQATSRCPYGNPQLALTEVHTIKEALWEQVCAQERETQQQAVATFLATWAPCRETREETAPYGA